MQAVWEGEGTAAVLDAERRIVLKVPDLEGLIQETEDQLRSSDLVLALDCIERSLRGIHPDNYIYPQPFQTMAERQGQRDRVKVMPGLKVLMAAYTEHTSDGPNVVVIDYAYKVGRLRELITQIKQEAEYTA